MRKIVLRPLNGGGPWLEPSQHALNPLLWAALPLLDAKRVSRVQVDGLGPMHSVMHQSP